MTTDNILQEFRPPLTAGATSKNLAHVRASKRRMAGLLLFLLYAAVAASHAQREQSDRPESLRLLQPYLWLGYVNHDQSVSFTFEVKNDADNVVKIVSADASCRCTFPEGKVPDEIPGHSTRAFKWVFNAGRSGEGLESKEIIITTAEGKDLVGKFEAWVGKGNEVTVKPKVRSGNR